jgi:hypothetical protein
MYYVLTKEGQQTVIAHTPTLRRELEATGWQCVGVFRSRKDALSVQKEVGR